MNILSKTIVGAALFYTASASYAGTINQRERNVQRIYNGVAVGD
jgi:hypothetical protein